jgi:hypothetical protein
MKEVTHYIFSMGAGLYLSHIALPHLPFAGQPAGILTILAIWLAFSVNRVIDGIGHTFKNTPYGDLPVRSWSTHSVFTAPLWGAAVGLASVLGPRLVVGWVGVSLPPGPIASGYALPAWAAALGAAIAYSHLFPDSLTQAGVFFGRHRIALAHWRYDNVFANTLFVLLGIGLLALALFNP